MDRKKLFKYGKILKEKFEAIQDQLESVRLTYVMSAVTYDVAETKEKRTLGIDREGKSTIGGSI